MTELTCPSAATTRLESSEQLSDQDALVEQISRRTHATICCSSIPHPRLDTLQSTMPKPESAALSETEQHGCSSCENGTATQLCAVGLMLSLISAGLPFRELSALRWIDAAHVLARWRRGDNFASVRLGRRVFYGVEALGAHLRGFETAEHRLGDGQ